MSPFVREFSSGSTLEEVSALASVVRRMAEQAGCTQEEIFALDLAASEAASNSVVHAYRKEPGHLVRVRLAVEPTEIVLTVLDDGWPVPPERRIPRPPPDGVDDPGLLAESGRGLYLIHQVMDSVSFETQDGSNVLVMKRRRPRIGVTAEIPKPRGNAS